MTPPSSRKKSTDASAGAASSFESEMEALETILAKLEAGELPLEEALALYEDGVGRIRRAHDLLTAAEGKLAELLPEAEALTSPPTKPADTADAKPAAGKPRSKAKKKPIDEEDPERWPEEDAPFDPSFGLDEEDT